jgi:hypothetical protein
MIRAFRSPRALVPIVPIISLAAFALLAWLGAGGAVSATPSALTAPAAASTVAGIAVPESMTVQGIPPVSPEIAEALQPYEGIRGAVLFDWAPGERRMLIGTRFADTVQLHEVAHPLGARTQLTFLKERVSTAAYRPGAPDQAVFSSDEGGAENFQLYLLDRRTGRVRRLTDGRHRFVDPLWSRDGNFLAYAGNARNGRDFDLYVRDMRDRRDASSGSERRVAELAGSWTPLDWSADGRRLLMLEEVSVNESYLHWIDLAGGAVHALTPRTASPDQGTVAYAGGRWSEDGQAVYTATDRDGEFLHLTRLDLATGAARVLSGDIPWDVERFDLSRDGRLLAFSVDADGVSQLHLLDAATGAALPAPELPAGVVRGLSFRPGSHEIGFQLSWARSPSDVWSYDADGRRLERWTESETGGLPAAAFAVPERRVATGAPSRPSSTGRRPIASRAAGRCSSTSTAGPRGRCGPTSWAPTTTTWRSWGSPSSAPTCAARPGTARATRSSTTACCGRTRSRTSAPSSTGSPPSPISTPRA